MKEGIYLIREFRKMLQWCKEQYLGSHFGVEKHFGTAPQRRNRHGSGTTGFGGKFIHVDCFVCFMDRKEKIRMELSFKFASTFVQIFLK